MGRRRGGPQGRRRGQEGHGQEAGGQEGVGQEGRARVERQLSPDGEAWLPAGFAHPHRVPVGDGHHLRPVRESDVHLDHPAVMASRERLWSRYGEAWGWPPATLTVEQDREDLARHEREIEAHESFNYALFDEAESRLLGCVYIDPPAPDDEPADAVVSWWVVDEVAGTDLERALDDLVPRWLGEAWPFRDVRWFPLPEGRLDP